MVDNSFKERLDVLDSIINSGDTLVTSEEILLMRKVSEAINVLEANMRRAERAGIPMESNLKSLMTNKEKVKQFLREFGND